MRRDVVQAQTRRKSDASRQSFRLIERRRCLLDQISNLHHRHSRLDLPPRILSNLSMDFGGSTNRIVIILVIGAFEMSLLFRCDAIRVAVRSLIALGPQSEQREAHLSR